MIRNTINRFMCNEMKIPIIIDNLSKNNMRPILDYINEDKNKHYDNFKKIKSNLQKYPDNYFAIKFSSLNIENDYDLAKKYSTELCEVALENNNKIILDAENYIIQDKINDLSNILVEKYNTDYVNIYKTYQCYRKDSFNTLTNDIKHKEIYDNYYLGIKLVRGAYYNEDYKHKILYDKIEDTHANYDRCALFCMLNLRDEDKLLIASHNENSIEKFERIKHKVYFENISYSQLMGMSDKLSKKLSKNNEVFKYVPYGKLIDSIPYLMRRLYENKDMIKYI